MKKLSFILGVGVAIIAGILLLVGCSESESDSDEVSVSSCTECHNDSTLVLARQVQWESSLHGSGLTFERNGGDCAACHTSEGFAISRELESRSLGEESIDNPSPVNCRTCHEIHTSYTEDDWALTISDSVTLDLTGDTINIGSGNLCATCHQPRTDYPIPQIGGGAVEITSTRYGPHHGPQSTVLLGLAGYNVGTTSSPHATKNGCAMCHMADAFGKQAGGHTMNMTYEYHGSTVDNTVACMSCHNDIEDFNYEGIQTEVEEMLEEVKELLVEQGLVTESGSGITGTFTSEQAGALWNYKTVEEDRSLGIHNARFTKALLQAALDALQ